MEDFEHVLDPGEEPEFVGTKIVEDFDDLIFPNHSLIAYDAGGGGTASSYALNTDPANAAHGNNSFAYTTGTRNNSFAGLVVTAAEFAAFRKNAGMSLWGKAPGTWHYQMLVMRLQPANPAHDAPGLVTAADVHGGSAYVFMFTSAGAAWLGRGAPGYSTFTPIWPAADPIDGPSSGCLKNLPSLGTINGGHNWRVLCFDTPDGLPGFKIYQGLAGDADLVTGNHWKLLYTFIDEDPGAIVLPGAFAHLCVTGGGNNLVGYMDMAQAQALQEAP